MVETPDLNELPEAEVRRRLAQLTRKTSLLQYLRSCHTLLSLPLAVRTPSRSTRGKIPAPQGKFCPARLLHWSDCASAQQRIFDDVCSFLHPSNEPPDEIFPTVEQLKGIAESLHTPLSSERDLESYERFAVENHVRRIIGELCKIPEARQKFHIGDGVMFESHSNALEDDPANNPFDLESTSSSQPRPDQFCIHRRDEKYTLLMTVEYKPPHKLTVENLRVGLQPQMDFWTGVVRKNKIPTDHAEKLRYNAEQIVGSVLTQEYHAMIFEGLELSYVTIGVALVLLRIPPEDPSTLLYFLCEPNMEITMESEQQTYREPRTAISRVLCLALMSCLSTPRDQAWRRSAMAQLQTWETSFSLVRSKIPDEELQQIPPGSEYTGSPKSASEGSFSEWIPSSPLPPTPARRTQPQRRATCAPFPSDQEIEPSDDSDSSQKSTHATRKRNHSQVASSPPGFPSGTRDTLHQSGESKQNNPGAQDHQYRYQQGLYCTQKCLLGLQHHGVLDAGCPNVSLHRQHKNDTQHPVSAEGLVRQLNDQLRQTLDHNCTPLSGCGEFGFGAPFKIISAQYGYTLLGKGTTSRLWSTVKKEADVYRILQKAQGSSVPVFLGTIDLAMGFCLHGAGTIQHMLLMAWGGIL
ncbi:hypothetical protein N7532_001415 [Penicillium argentinense]|uniref:Uncharacterized protein n=1 Tax=Penicillium argentinense TaxID=1131581 RepID=A0A9W9KLR9_9EURO|nr:uncharacterized protein N7532_001415 [Penicillium argentinense]KAJ5110880.1 hypothetical protein N7532_001415 [Penicillium argentinense]